MPSRKLHGVTLIDWPAQAGHREHCRTHRMPRVLVVAPGHQAPDVVDVYEDWVRVPVPARDLDSRARMLASRQRLLERPLLTSAGHLLFREEGVGLSPLQSELLAPLVARYEELVPRLTLEHHAGISQDNRHLLDRNIARLRSRLWSVGLTIRAQRGLGYILEPLETT